jgi:hypothetical protein
MVLKLLFKYAREIPGSTKVTDFITDVSFDERRRGI